MFGYLGEVGYEPPIVAHKLKNDLTSVTVVGWGHSVTAVILSGSVKTPSLLTMCPKWLICCLNRSYLVGLSVRPAALSLLMTALSL